MSVLDMTADVRANSDKEIGFSEEEDEAFKRQHLRRGRSPHNALVLVKLSSPAADKNSGRVLARTDWTGVVSKKTKKNSCLIVTFALQCL